MKQRVIYQSDIRRFGSITQSNTELSYLKLRDVNLSGIRCNLAAKLLIGVDYSLIMIYNLLPLFRRGAWFFNPWVSVSEIFKNQFDTLKYGNLV